MNRNMNDTNLRIKGLWITLAALTRRKQSVRTNAG
jgi:hypothetical protein